jgi:hypothetical protein
MGWSDNEGKALVHLLRRYKKLVSIRTRLLFALTFNTAVFLKQH